MDLLFNVLNVLIGAGALYLGYLVYKQQRDEKDRD